MVTKNVFLDSHNIDPAQFSPDADTNRPGKESNAKLVAFSFEMPTKKRARNVQNFV